MSDEISQRPQRLLLWYERWMLGLLGVVLLTLLGTASFLSPSTQGLGTHQQLGLPPCSFATQFGVRCPSCGMTTSWSHLMNGNLIGSLKANSAGCILGILSLITGPWAFISAVRGTWAAGPPSEMVLLTITIGLVIITIADWLYRIL